MLLCCQKLSDYRSNHFSHRLTRFLIVGMLLVGLFSPYVSSAEVNEEIFKINLKQYMNIVTGENIRFKSSELDWKVAQDAIQNEEGKFDTEFYGSWKTEKNKKRNTVQESLSVSSLSEFEERNNIYNFGLKKKVPTGATLELDLSNRDLENNVQPDYIRGQEHAFVSALNLRQPILKGAWSASTLDLRISEKGEDIAFQIFREIRLSESLRAVDAYWDFFQSQGAFQLSQHSVSLLEKMLSFGKKRTRLGNIPLTDVMRVESRLAAERSFLIHKKQRFTQTMNSLKDFMAISAVKHSYEIEVEQENLVTAVENIPSPDVDVMQSVQTAYERNPAYLAAKHAAQSEQLKLVFAEDQTLAEIDLVASYRLNGLSTSFEDSAKDAFKANHPGWSVGLEFRIPLANNQARSQLSAAKAKKQQAIYEIKETEIKLANQVSSLTEDIKNKYENIKQLEKVKDINLRLYQIHEQSYLKANVTIDDVIESERRLAISREALLTALTEYQKSVFRLKQIEGSLLTYFDIDEPLQPAIAGGFS